MPSSKLFIFGEVKTFLITDLWGRCAGVAGVVRAAPRGVREAAGPAGRALMLLGARRAGPGGFRRPPRAAPRLRRDGPRAPALARPGGPRLAAAASCTPRTQVPTGRQSRRLSGHLNLQHQTSHHCLFQPVI